MTTTSAPAVSSEWIDIDTSDGPMRAFLARPQSTPRGGVVVLQEAFGVNDYVQDVTRRLAENGYLAMAPELFHREPQPLLDYQDTATAMATIGGLGPDQITVDVHATLDVLAAHYGIERTAVSLVGFCFGGRAAFTAAADGDPLAGTVVFYGPGICTGPWAVIDRIGQIACPVLMHVGDQDPTIPASDVAALRTAADESGADLEVIVYPGAGHAFACHARPALVHQQAAEAAWERTLTFLAEHHRGSAGA